jgi:hypothetical protein
LIFDQHLAADGFIREEQEIGQAGQAETGAFGCAEAEGVFHQKEAAAGSDKASGFPQKEGLTPDSRWGFQRA